MAQLQKGDDNRGKLGVFGKALIITLGVLLILMVLAIGAVILAGLWKLFWFILAISVMG
jgi:hypothetical protein